jgi:RNA polymerase sigma-70 factor (ECF subfamily)
MATLTDDDRPASSSATPRSLLERVQAADAAAWGRLVELYAPLVLHWCRRGGLRAEDAADVFQDVFHAVAAHVRGFRRDRAGATFRGWLRAVTRSKVADHFRRLRHEPAGLGGSDARQFLAQLPAPDAPEDDADAERSLFHRTLESIRSEFEPRTWQAFWRTAVGGECAADVAADLGMSPGAVRVAKSRVLQRLRQELGDS